MDHTPANRFEQSVSEDRQHAPCNHHDGNCNHCHRRQKRPKPTAAITAPPGGGETMTKRFSVCNQPRDGFHGPSFVPHPETMADHDSRAWEENQLVQLADYPANGPSALRSECDSFGHVARAGNAVDPQMHAACRPRFICCRDSRERSCGLSRKWRGFKKNSDTMGLASTER
jgi:hypothetical protein